MIAVAHNVTVQTNPNTWGAWLGRIEQIVTILVALAGFVKWVFIRLIDERIGPLHQNLEEMRDSLESHTAAEADIIRRVVREELLHAGWR